MYSTTELTSTTIVPSHTIDCSHRLQYDRNLQRQEQGLKIKMHELIQVIYMNKFLNKTKHQ